MLQERSAFSFRNLATLPSHFQKLGLVGTLCAVNMGLIALLGALMMALSGQIAFFILSLLMTVSTGGMIALFFLNYEKPNFFSKTHPSPSFPYEENLHPLLHLSPDLYLTYGNQKALDDCWWAENTLILEESLACQESKEALARLFDAFAHRKEITETLIFRGKHEEESWHIHSTPQESKALWQCHKISSSEKKAPSSPEEINVLTTLLDARAEGLFCLNKKGIILFCNEKFSQWLDYKREDLIGSPLTKFLTKTRSTGSLPLLELQGKCDFMTSASRVKSLFLEQTQLPFEGEFITYSLAYLHTPFIEHSDLSRIFNTSPLPIACLDEKGLIQDSNFLFRDQIWSADTPAKGASFLDFVVDSQREEVRNAFHAFLNGHEEGTPLEIQLNDAKESIVAAYLATLSLEDRKGLLIQFNDITDQKKFESQLGQSQKMQAVGQLAGGIAHDFNNLLTAMIGFCDLLLLRHTPGDQSFTDVMQIKQNANRAANLVRQLLAFSRQQTLQPKVLDITESLAELSALLRRLIGSNIELKIKHERDLGLVLVDQGQLEQVIINLAVNARDSMEGGGEIIITTQNYEFKKAKRYGADVIPPGPYVLVEVSDTGVGIKPEIIDRIFDPFFSTKEVGSGTGLGLSTVYGIVKQTGGFIQVKSKVGEGTTFSIYLPQYLTDDTKAVVAPSREKTPPQDLTGSSTILLVEDEDAVRLFSARALRSKGYTVIEAVNGTEALDLIKTNDKTIDLVISDVIMPQMDGPTFIKEMNDLNINPKVLFISGYTEDTFHDQLNGAEKVAFLSKPFSLNDLATRVKEILDEEES